MSRRTKSDLIALRQSDAAKHRLMSSNGGLSLSIKRKVRNMVVHHAIWDLIAMDYSNTEIAKITGIKLRRVERIRAMDIEKTYRDIEIAYLKKDDNTMVMHWDDYAQQDDAQPYRPNAPHHGGNSILVPETWNDDE